MDMISTVLIATVSTLMSSIITSAIWSHSAFSQYALLSERIAVLETKVDITIAVHEVSCANFKPKG